jgi:hypothetical protein
MVVCVGIGIFTMLANYFCMLDYGAELPPHWFRGYIFMSLTCIVIGYMAVTDIPRRLGKKFLVLLHSIQSPGTSFGPPPPIELSTVALLRSQPTAPVPPPLLC